MARVLEKVIEDYFVRQVKSKLGGRAIKLTSSGHRGLPDRFCVLPEGRIFFCELKAPGRKPSKLQELTIKMLRSLGHYAVVADTKAGVDVVITFFLNKWYNGIPYDKR